MWWKQKELFAIKEYEGTPVWDHDLRKPQPKRAFDGDIYDPKKDYVRLARQLSDVFELMKDGQWRTLDEIAEDIGAGSQASVSARLRDLRKAKYGSHTVDRRRVQYGLLGLHQYRLTIRT